MANLVSKVERLGVSSMNVLLRDVCDIEYGFPFDSSRFNETEGLPLIRIRDIVRGYSETRTSEECPPEYIVENGDILVGMDGEFNIARWRGGRSVLNQRVCRLSPRDGIIGEFLFHFMPKALKRIEDATPFVTVKHLSARQLNSVMIPLPPLAEQKRIAEALDKISEMKRNAEARLQKLDLLVKARFNEMFGTVADGKFPCVKLDDICEFIKDGTHQTPTYTEDSKRGYKFLSSKDVTSGRIDWSHIKYIPPELHEELYKRIAPRRGDVLLAKNGTTGIAALVDNDEVFDIYVSLALLRFKQGNDPRFLLAAINSSDTRRQFNSSLKGIGVPNLHLGEIKKAQIPLPPLSLQRQFATFVEKVEAQKSIAQKELEKVDLLYRAKLQEYFG